MSRVEQLVFFEVSTQLLRPIKSMLDHAKGFWFAEKIPKSILAALLVVRPRDMFPCILIRDWKPWIRNISWTGILLYWKMNLRWISKTLKNRFAHIYKYYLRTFNIEHHSRARGVLGLHNLSSIKSFSDWCGSIRRYIHYSITSLGGSLTSFVRAQWEILLESE